MELDFVIGLGWKLLGKGILLQANIVIGIVQGLTYPIAQ